MILKLSQKTALVLEEQAKGHGFTNAETYAEMILSAAALQVETNGLEKVLNVKYDGYQLEYPEPFQPGCAE